MNIEDSPSAEQQKGEAICFTSGPSGAAFSAGVIHAWLAADRDAPLVAAGVSTGAVSAAALEFCYRELKHARQPGAQLKDVEQKRWEWYRRYLAAVTQDPLRPIWESIPDPLDFRSTTPPVRDLSVPPLLEDQEEEARKHFFVLTKLGIWLGGVPVRISNIATIAVMLVRLKEVYGVKPLNAILLGWNIFKTTAGMLWHFLRAPNFIAEIKRQQGKSKISSIRPLFGWTYWLGSWVAVIMVLAVVVSAVTLGQVFIHPWGWRMGQAVACLLFPISMFMVFKWRSERDGSQLWQELIARILEELGLVQGLLHPYQISRKLYDLFDNACLDDDQSAFPLLLVSAALEQTDQVWARGGAIYQRLSAALSVPGLFPPAKIAREELANVHKEVTKKTPKGYKLSIVDGSAVRSNPIPAFFEWCKSDASPSIMEALEKNDRDHPALHVVYSVPIEPDKRVDQADALNDFDIVEAAELALELEKRRDTRQEVSQTNFTSRLETIRRRVTTGTAKTNRGPFTIFADEIAPRDTIEVGNHLDPGAEKLLAAAAQGCKETLQILYRDLIPKNQGLQCSALLTQIAPLRALKDAMLPGVPEVCNACDGRLCRRAAPSTESAPEGMIRSYGLGPTDATPQQVAAEHPNLRQPSRVVFLGSGGVFRGAFHIGVLSALKASRLFPDLVIGASVGALMGGALANISTVDEHDETEILEHLALVFLTVDTSVALTRTLKNAAKQIGTRARLISLSPSELRRRVLGGSQADPGYAATGAPPVLIDAISSLFEIPHRETTAIASQFVAGHITAAANQFLQALREETLQSFEIKTHLMGIDLLAGVARKLLGYDRTGLRSAALDRSHLQPYHAVAAGKNRVSLFSTTSFLNGRVSLLLGRDFLDRAPTWDGLYAGLSSSAFPAVFAPRTESDLLPGKGRADRLFGDGGMFDNLPFLPAYEVLGVVQEGSTESKDLRSRLLNRVSHPNLFIAAGLDVKPETLWGSWNFDSLNKIRDRAKMLSIESKTRTYALGAVKTVNAMRDIGKSPVPLAPDEESFLQRAVSSYVLSISPKDKDHINPTFAFCRSTGLDKERVRRSIGDGCYQTLVQLASDPVAEDIISARNLAPIMRLQARPDAPSQPPLKTTGTRIGPEPAKKCPFFLAGDASFDCPFARAGHEDVQAIWATCSRDHAE